MILNRQRRVRVPVRALDEFVLQACRALRLPDQAFTICLVGDDEMARWNSAYRGKKGPTDVLSFPIDGAQARNRIRKKPLRKSPASASLPQRKAMSDSATSIPDDISNAYLGDIAIAPAVARRNAQLYERSFGDEMRILILHGILHLLGYDHETDTGQMNRREKQLRRALGLA
jgi:probable rRNA maturation factor